MYIRGFVLQTLLLINLVTFCRAGLMLVRATVHPDNPSSCWSNRLNESVPVGGIWQESQCRQATCIYFRNELFIEVATCGHVAVSLGCTTVRDMSQDYPKCCPWAYCPEVSMDDLLGPEYEEFRDWVDTYYDEPASDYV